MSVTKTDDVKHFEVGETYTAMACVHCGAIVEYLGNDMPERCWHCDSTLKVRVGGMLKVISVDREAGTITVKP